MTKKFHDLVAGARSYRRFDQSKKMTMQELEELAELGRITPCGGNRQYIRFALCADEEKNEEIYKNLAWAGYLSDWDGPVEGERPTGYILILRDGARDMGYGGCMLMNIKRTELMEIFGLDPEKYAISMVIALGVPVEEVKMVEVKDDDIKYYRDENQVHYVPKRSLKDVVVKEL